MKKIMFVFVLITMIFVLSGCASSDMAEYYENGDDYETEDTTPIEPAPTTTTDEIAGGEVFQDPNIPALLNRKIIYSATLEMLVEEPEDVYEDIIDVLDGYTAYIESADINGTRYIVKIRVLSENFDALINDIKTSGDVIGFTKSSEDVTNAYSTFEARLEALEAQHARIIELIEVAVDLDTILELEQARFEIESELNQIGDTLANYDSLVDFSTIDVTIRKVTEQEVVLPRTATPNINVYDIARNGAQVNIYNQDELPVVINMDLYVNGEFIREYEETALGDSVAKIVLSDLDSFTEYTLKVTVIANNQRVSYEDTYRFETEKTFWNKVGNVFTVSLDTLITLFEFLGLAFVALVPYIVVAGVLFFPIRALSRKKVLKKFFPHKKEPLQEDKE